MSVFEDKLNRLIKLYRVECPDEFKEWLIDLHREDIIRVMGPRPDLSTFEDITDLNRVYTCLEAYEANFFNERGKLESYDQQMKRAEMEPEDFVQLADRIGW